MSKLRVNCWKPEMAISSQAQQKCGDGSETRLYGLTGFYANLSVEYKGYESPRAPGNQEVQQMWNGVSEGKLLRTFRSVQTVLARKMCQIPSIKSGQDKAVSKALVCEEQRSCFGAMQEIQLQAGGQGT